MRILLVHQCSDTLEVLANALKREGLSVFPAATQEHVLRRLVSEHPQAVVAGVSLAGDADRAAALSLVREIRKAAQVPLLLVGDQRDDSFVIRTYEAGIDAFVPAPCSPPVLAARLRALCRPARAPQEDASPILRAEEFMLDPGGYEVFRLRQGEPPHAAEVLPLTRTEFRLFYLLAANAGRVVNSTRLAEYAAEGRGRRGAVRVRQSMARLRQKLGLPHRGTSAIVAHPGVGYQYTGLAVSAGTTASGHPAAPPDGFSSDAAFSAAAQRAAPFPSRWDLGESHSVRPVSVQ